MIDQFIDHFCKLIKIIMVIFLAIMVVLVFGNVVLRYGFNSGLALSDELSRWLFVWITFMGAVVAMKEGTHLGTDTLISRLSVRGQKICFVLANLLMLFVGCFLEPTAAITILVPILVPICQQLGIDLVHFGLVMVLNLMIGLLHPPMGMVLFVLARVAKLSVERTTMAILPWLFPLLGSLAVITYFPNLVLWLPKQFY
jgi:TRAP-type C4-dicarboxylate transport system permease small subunit